MATATLDPTAPNVAIGQVQLFRAGTHTDSGGQTNEWSLADLKEMIDAYNESVAAGLHEAPILIGHDGNTAYGWLGRVDLSGDALIGDYKDVEEWFAQCLEKKRYKKRSISIYPRKHPGNPTPGRYNIRHLAYVGVPAVKGMSDEHQMSRFRETDDPATAFTFDFNEGTPDVTPPNEGTPPVPTPTGFDEGIADATPTSTLSAPVRTQFMESDFDVRDALKALTQIVSRLRDGFVEKDGVEATNNLLPPELMNTLNQVANQSPKQMLGEEEMQRFTGMVDDCREEIRRFTGMVDDYRKTIGSLQAQLVELRDRCDRFEAIGQPSPTPLYQEKEMTSQTANPEPAHPTAEPAGPTVSTTEFAELQQQFAELQTQRQADQDTIAVLQTQVQTLINANQTLMQERDHSEVSAFVDRMINARKVRPQERDLYVSRLIAMPNANPIQYQEGDTTVSLTPRQLLQQQIEASKELWSDKPIPTHPGSFGDPGLASDHQFEAPIGTIVDSNSLALHHKALAYCETKGWDINQDPNAYTKALVAVSQ